VFCAIDGKVTIESEHSSELYKRVEGYKRYYAVLLVIVEFWGIVIILPAFLVLPGILFTIVYVMGAGLVAVLLWPLHGSRVVSSRKERKESQEEFAGEKWLYINGSMTR
jgi:hypothetical protein